MLLPKAIPVRYIYKKVRYDIWFVLFYAIGVTVTGKYVDFGFLLLPASFPAILATSIALLLAFRINQAYDRWWEARKIWGAIVNDSRTIVRQLLYFLPDDSNNEELNTFKRTMAYRQIAWCYSLGQTLRKLDPVKNIEQLLPEDEISFIKEHDNVPNAILMLHSRDLQWALNKNWTNEYQQVQMDTTVRQFCDWMGMCERIKNTVFPTTYSLFVHFFIYLLVLILPFALLEYHWLIEIPMIAAISSLFFMIERSAIHMQDPFENRPTDTPVTAIARTIEINIRQMLDEKEVPEKIKPEEFYLM